MLKYLRTTIVFGLILLSSLAYSQYQVSEHLWTSSDEIVLIKVIDEKAELWQSLTGCKSYVTVEIIRTYKSKRFAPELKQLIFERLFNCSKEHGATNAPKLKRDMQYIIFLSSENPGEVIHPGEATRKIYHLIDLGLGILEFNDQLEGFLSTKQREKR